MRLISPSPNVCCVLDWVNPLMFGVHRGKMIPEELEKLVIKHKNEGHLPFFVNCTTGTTVYGAFDPISDIAGEI